MRKQDDTGCKGSMRLLYSVFMWLYIFVLIFVAISFLFSLKEDSLKAIYTNVYFYLINGVVDGISLGVYLMLYRIDGGKLVLEGNDLEDSRWLSIKDLKKLKEFKVYNISKANEMEDGIVIGAEKKGKDIEIATTSQLHALIVGTTGSGKTTGFVDQNIEILSRTKDRPSLVITDPKKELYEKHSKQLIKQGYNILMLDLREPYSSSRWNPLSVLTRRIKLVKELLYNLKSKDGRYYAAGEEFLSHKEARGRKQELLDEIYENAKDLVYTLCPVENKDQPTWESGARNLILGLVLAFCEDCINNKIDEKQLTLFNIYHNITKYCKEDTKVLREYLIDSRDEFSKVKSLVNTVLITSDKTLTSYLSEVNSYMQQLTDEGLLSLTSENDLDLINIDEKPTAVFVIIPDERQTRHRFVTLFITQLYKELVEKANLNFKRGEKSEAILKRNTYFILDEFGNLPRFESMDSIVTVSRSRGIRFLFILQSFSQLTNKYGKEVGDVIKSNCNVKLFIGSDDQDTRKEFSELCGQKKIKSLSINSNLEHSASSSIGAQNQPLITIGMLERINGEDKGDAIVSVRGYEAIWTRFTPSYEAKEIYFSEGKADLKKKKTQIFDKEQYLYDITGVSIQKENEEMIELINKKDEEYQEDKIDKQIDKRVIGLDKEWEDVKAEIDIKIEELAAGLSDKDAEAIRKAELKDKVILLYEFMRRYNSSMKLKLQKLAKFISERQIPKLELIKKQAISGGNYENS